MKFNEPIHGMELEFEMIPLSQFIVSPYQRQRSAGLITKLLASMQHGFFCPIIAIRNENGKLEVPDGQHRIEALSGSSLDADIPVPTIIVPEKFRILPLIYNQEKSDNIKDISEKLHALYCDLARDNQDAPEQAIANSCLGVSYYITIAFAYKESNLGSPSLVESAVKKLDRDFLTDIPLSSAISIRRAMGVRTAALENAINDIAKSYHVTDYNLKKSILSQTTQKLWGRTRKLDMPFNDGIDMLIETIEEEDWGWLSRR